MERLSAAHSARVQWQRFANSDVFLSLFNPLRFYINEKIIRNLPKRYDNMEFRKHHINFRRPSSMINDLIKLRHLYICAYKLGSEKLPS